MGCDQDVLRKVLEHWGTGVVDSIEEVAASGVYAIGMRNGDRAILKRIGEDSPDLAQRHVFCHDVLKHLSAHSVPVAVPIPDTEGNTLSRHGQYLYVLLPHVQHERLETGGDPAVLGRCMSNTGQSFALLHEALGQFPRERIGEYVWRAPLSAEIVNYRSRQVLQYLTGEEQVRFSAMFLEAVPRMCEAFVELPEQLIHRDCHCGNVLFRDCEVVAFVDCDHFSVGPRVFDIGYFITSLVTYHPLGMLEPTRWLEAVPLFLSGYRRHVALAPSELGALYDAALSTPLQISGWLFENGMPDLARKLLNTFAWMHEHQAETRASFDAPTIDNLPEHGTVEVQVSGGN